MLINIFNTITNLSPNVEGMTAISSWMIACMMFVFFALLGYAGLLYYSLVSYWEPICDQLHGDTEEAQNPPVDVDSGMFCHLAWAVSSHRASNVLLAQLNGGTKCVVLAQKQRKNDTFWTTCASCKLLALYLVATHSCLLTYQN